MSNITTLGHFPSTSTIIIYKIFLKSKVIFIVVLGSLFLKLLLHLLPVHFKQQNAINRGKDCYLLTVYNNLLMIEFCVFFTCVVLLLFLMYDYVCFDMWLVSPSQGRLSLFVHSLSITLSFIILYIYICQISFSSL